MKSQDRGNENKEKNYIFIDKAVFFPKSGILAIGDLHLGYEHMLIESGISLPENQAKEIIKSIEEILLKIKSQGFSAKKIVFLGDIKHYFGFDHRERRIFDRVLEFLREKFEDKDVILIKGNHDKMDYSGKKMKNYYINEGVCFLHGHMSFPEIYDSKVNTIVMGHMHPSVTISDKANVKREKFKCFLLGEFHKKRLIIVPSFFEIIEGTSVNEYAEDYRDYFSIVPKKVMMNCEIFAIGEKEIFDFGKVKGLN
ncbi:MAG: metallophosphoesterase [Nanoarchaeota archaeon]|nr:metallophosphoesterase [Nanoarchaeota archaeon]